jgi:hypothetical protein
VSLGSSLRGSAVTNSAKRNNRVIDLQTLEENMSKVKNYCSDEKNFKVPVMKAVEQVLGKSN